MKEKKTVQYQIYQLNHNDPTIKQIRFMSFDEIKQYHYSIEHINYEFIYQGMTEWKDSYSTNDLLDRIYAKFNIEIPNDFYGYSLSVSDVIVLMDEEKRTAYFVDRAGFRVVPDFFLRKETDVYSYTYTKAVEQGEVNVYMYSFKKIRIVHYISKKALTKIIIVMF